MLDSTGLAGSQVAWATLTIDDREGPMRLEEPVPMAYNQ